MSLSAFRARVKAVLSVGDTIDSLLDGFLKDALFVIEGRITFPYMRLIATKTLTPADRLLTFTGFPKTVNWARRREVVPNGFRYFPIALVKEWEAGLTGEGKAGYAWMLDEQTIEFDQAEAAGTVVQVHSFAYTAWPPADGSPIFSRYERVFLARSIMELVPVVRKPELMQIYKPIFDEEMTALQAAVDELLAGSATYEMGSGSYLQEDEQYAF